MSQVEAPALDREQVAATAMDHPAAGESELGGDNAFVHLVVHSEFSINDGLAKVRELAARAAKLGMPALALTDRANLFGLVKFQTACREVGVKALIGADLEYQEPGGGICRCVVLVASPAGYRNLLQLVSSTQADTAADSGDEANQTHGRVTHQAILAAADGLVVLLGRASDVGAVVANNAATAARRLAAWRRAFDDRVYLEVVRTGRRGEDAFVAEVVALATTTGVPVAASNDVRFLDRADFEAHETRVCIQEKRVLNDPRRERRYSEQQYLRTPAQMRQLFADLPEALDNTVEIAKRCSYQVELGTYHLPRYPAPEGLTLDALLQQRARAGLSQLGEAGATKRYRDRLEYELGIIVEMGFSGYFLIVQEFVNWARDHGVPVGCRGSGNASLVAFCLGITDLDPLRYDLIFERLLNPQRVSMPDFDIDFCMEGREKVIAHVAERYGHDAVGQIVTFGTMAARLVVRDVARVQGKPFGLADRLSKMIPFKVGMTLAKAMNEQEELSDYIDRNEDAAEIMDMAYKLEGVVRNIGKHAGGVVIAPGALTDFVPLYVDRAGGMVSQFDFHDVEDAGLVKFDFLGLKTLTVVDWALAAVNAERERRAEAAIDIKRLPLDDPGAYALLKTAETTAVFQLESEGMKDLLRRFLPDSMEDIIALVALYRPGPLQSGTVEDYVNRKHGRSRVVYSHPLLEEILAGTYGVMLYQEQVMNIAQRLAGFSLGQADLLRHAMGKKKPEEMARMRASFLAGASANDIAADLANGIFDQMEKFAGYAFNKAHAASYALLAFQTAWLKAHYPVQFMAAVLSADMQNIDKVVALIDEVKRMRIHLRPPHVNLGAFRFVPRDGEIHYGLGAVRGVGEAHVAAIIEERQRAGEFADLGDFCRRVEAGRVNRRVVEALIRAGAMDPFATTDETLDDVRGRLFGELPQALQGAEQLARNAQLGIEDMIGGVSKPNQGAARQGFRRLSLSERLKGEKDTLGLYLTGHPINDYLDEIRRFCPVPIATLRAGRDNQWVAGSVVSIRILQKRRGDMAFAVLDDRSGRIEVSVFSEVLKQYRAKLTQDAILLVEGRVQADEFTGGGSLKLRATRIQTMAEMRRQHARGIVVSVVASTAGGDFAGRLKGLLAPHRYEGGGPHRSEGGGPHRSERGCAVSVDYQTAGAGGRVMLGDAWRVDASDELLAGLRDEFGDQCVLVDYDDR